MMYTQLSLYVDYILDKKKFVIALSVYFLIKELAKLFIYLW